ncbi:hypothetical protein WHR41_02934 [Cladosporium halotolerans]|uniref:Tyrosine specific protein phosphatases domain-containing protein n=1 Tax=Cladosporium halotolerans TaxID=1052096 RepID=A0AB34KXW5_9PEZI
MNEKQPEPKISNFRDVALSVNAPPSGTKGTRLKPCLLYRSALPSPSALAHLTQTHSIKTIIDLRTTTEILEQQQQPNPPSNQTSESSPKPTTHPISLTSPAYTLSLLSHLTWPQLLRLAYLYAFAPRPAAVSLLATHVLAPRGLAGLAIDTLTYSAAEIARVLTLLSDPASYPVLVHCTQGKDRTGLVCLLVCLLCGVGVEGLEADYWRSDEELAGEREEREREVGRIGLPGAWAGCEGGWVGRVREWLEGEWGGVEGYLEGACGLEGEVVEGVRRVLVEGWTGGEVEGDDGFGE